MTPAEEELADFLHGLPGEHALQQWLLGWAQRQVAAERGQIMQRVSTELSAYPELVQRIEAVIALKPSSARSRMDAEALAKELSGADVICYLDMLTIFSAQQAAQATRETWREAAQIAWAERHRDICEHCARVLMEEFRRRAAQVQP